MGVKALIFDTLGGTSTWFVKTCRAWLLKCAPESGSRGD